ncbi:unnamed protein product [Adineta steineri]|uniref:Glycosyltransferase family 92 protein n=1 Tax=Adineta steineri TaxID=433720 RepID=A0A818VSN2_9BILA|nr:unnamed protein product [Adineta steineri]CAF1229748.1 unnamed protein product [Adineta steineri]CAF3579384.1 unnamed protein product [Adineta steineri]CAF3715247.1 unnamed protein product [Adineta steineri]
MCTTKWYKQLQLEFNVFSVKNFTKVIFMMDYLYTNITDNGSYKCIFFHFGTNKTINPQLLTRIGGKDISDPHKHTLCLQCDIPNEAIHQNATTIDFMLISDNDLINGVVITICRFYNSSFNFLNSRIYLENTTRQLELINKSRNRNSTLIASCTQTSHHDLYFPLWINYHYKMGIDHFYIYDHAPSNLTRLHHSLKSYIDLNIITIIPWYINQWNGFKYRSSPSEWIAHQIWSQNDCIHRYGYLYSWILISDVDELVVPTGNLTNFKQMLDIVPSNYCALQVLSYNFKSLHNNITVSEEDRPKRFIHRDQKSKNRNSHSKNFVRPELIYYFSVHEVTKSVNESPVFYADVQTHGRIQHYRGDFIPTEQLANFTIDTHILSFINQINNSLSSIS